MSNNSIFVHKDSYDPFAEVLSSTRVEPIYVPDMAMFNYKFGALPKEPAVYKIKIEKDAQGNKSFKLVKDLDRFAIKDKYYGRTIRDVKRTWNTYKHFIKNGEKQFAFGAVGFKGMGKTEYLSLVANMAMDEEKMICVLVTEIQSSPELVRFLSSLDNAFIMFDEFGKVFPRNSQDLMLTMFNNLGQKHRIIAASDNSLDAFGEFFQNRTGRIHYLLEFWSIDQEIISEYAKDAGAKPAFIKEIIKASKRVSNFSMDYIQGLLKEHKIYPEDSLDDLLYYLNLKALKHRILVYVDKIERMVPDENGKEEMREMNFSCNRSGDMLKEDFFGSGYSLYINIDGVKPTAEEYEKRLKEIEEDKKNGIVNNNNQSFNPWASAPKFNAAGQPTYKDNLYIDNSDEIVNKKEVGEIEYYTFNSRDYFIHIRVQEKK